MKVRYNRKEDIFTLEVSKTSIDHAEESGPIIAHFSATAPVAICVVPILSFRRFENSRNVEVPPS